MATSKKTRKPVRPAPEKAPPAPSDGRSSTGRPQGFMQRNSITLAFAVLMVLSLVGHALTGAAQENVERASHGLPPETVGEYLGGGSFQSTLFENWESEFLQMGLLVLFTVWLRQRGSAESRKMDPEEETPDPEVPKAEQPWPVRAGGLWKSLYAHSLSAALLLLFAVSGVAHFVASWRHHAEVQARHGEAVTPMAQYAGEPQFWFESFQNWQSEFLAVIALALLSIWLREKDSTQSKPLTARHTDTGH